MRGLLGVACVSLLVACGGGGGGSRATTIAKPTPKPIPPETAVDNAAAMFLELGRVVMEAKSNCDVMASNVGAWLDANEARRQRINSALRNIQAETLKTRYRSQLNAHLGVVLGMQAGLDGCRAHAGMAKAWGRLDR